MTQPVEHDAIYRRRRFPREVIEGCARWYLTYHLSYRDLVALMAEWDGMSATRPSCAGCSGTSRNTSGGGTAGRSRWAGPGEWMRRTFGLGRRRDTCTARSTSRARRSSRCSRRSAELLLRWPFSARQWHPARHGGRARSLWTDTSKVIGHCAGCVGKTSVGYPCGCAIAST